MIAGAVQQQQTGVLLGASCERGSWQGRLRHALRMEQPTSTCVQSRPGQWWYWQQLLVSCCCFVHTCCRQATAWDVCCAARSCSLLLGLQPGCYCIPLADQLADMQHGPWGGHCCSCSARLVLTCACL
jgi:hypothetical protein